jgi:hypothetical protein
MNKESKIEVFRLFILFGFIISIIFHYISSVQFGNQFPTNTFLFNPNDQFMDFINCYKVKGSIYFPFANLIIYLFSLVPSINNSLISYLIITSCAILFLVFYLIRDNSKSNSILNTLIFTFFTFPFLFLVDRANFESFVFIFLLIFIYLFSQKKYTLSTIPLALAVSMKLFPILFLLLFIKNKLWKQILISLLLMLSITTISLFILDLDINNYFLQLSNNSSFYTKYYVIGHGGLDYGHSLFGLFKVFLLYLKLPQYIPSLLTPYLIFVIVLFIFFSFIIIYKIDSLWKNCTIIVILFCLLPNVSADYKLIHFLIPILLYINDNSSFGKNTKSLKILKLEYDLNHLYILLFSILLIPKNYRFLSKAIYDGVYIDPIIMILFLILFVFIKEDKKVITQNTIL